VPRSTLRVAGILKIGVSYLSIPRIQDYGGVVLDRYVAG
jgi:hypothetical protein